ncbi:hypothetical protein AGR13a_Cc20008 [Agrobacterium genomosp. 13 str. CFBP 6927]|uniref:Uncharacterized protein n=1 Tax=Agrobacterium genomosp. 13 str. CFBP 6927 TaxID=1183428 RepID=A0ABP2BGF9_9HYPH|nr:hypothetical protein AGR13a_Cc20008 [Agrobacterium genomosp. 13 str. CFBP 6927]
MCSRSWDCPLEGSACKNGTGFFEIVRRIDAKRHGADDFSIDAHVGFQCAQLFQPLAFLQRRWRKAHECLECCAAIGVKPDMVIKRPVTVRRGRTGKIKRAQSRLGKRTADDFHDVRIGFFFLVGDFDRQRRNVDGRIFQRAQRSADCFRLNRRKVALDIDDIFGLAIGVGLLQSLENAVRTGLVIVARHHHIETGIFYGRKNLFVIHRDDDSLGPCFTCPQRNLHDHRLAANVRERLAGQACGCHPRRYEDDSFLEIPILHPTPFKSRPKSVKTSRCGEHYSSCAGCAKAIAFEQFQDARYI